MDSMIPIGQKNTLAEYMILSGANNRSPMLEKDLYDSWKSRMELYMQNREHGRMILESVEHEKIQADCDLKVTNIILQGLPSDIYLHVNHHRVSKDLWERIQLLMQGTSLTKQEWECKVYDAFDKFAHIKWESLHQYYLRFTQLINDMNIYKMKLEQFQVNTKFLNSLPPEWIPVFKQGDDPIDAINKMMSFLSTFVSSCFPTTKNQLRNYSNPRQQATIIDGRVTVQPVQGRQNSFAAGISGARANISGPGGNNLGQQRVVKCFNCQGEDHGVAEGPVTQTVITHNAAYQADDLDAYDYDRDDFSIAKAVLMANLSSYGSNVLSELSLKDIKNRVKLLEERQNVDLSTREKLIMDDIIQEKNAQFVDFEKEITYLKQTLSKQSKEKELLTKTFNVFKNKSKEKEAKNIDKEIDLEKKVKELDNIKAQQIRPMLYDGSVIAKETNVILIADSGETLMLEEVSRSKMFLKQKLSDEQAFWLQTSHPNTDKFASSPVKIEAPRELPKVILVNTSLKKLKYHLGQFDNVVKKQITPNTLTEGEWGFEHTKAVFLKEIILFLKTLKDIFNVFDKDLLNEVTEVQTVFNQMEATVQQYNIVNIVVNCSVNVHSSVDMNDSVKYVEICNKCLELEAKLIKQHTMVEKDEYNRFSKSFSKLEQHCISLELAMQLNKEIFQKNNTSVNQTEPSFDQLFELNNLKAELQAKDITIKKLKLDPVTLAPKDKNNKETHIYYLKHTIEQAAILREIVEQAKSLNPLDSASYYACKYVKLIQELLGYVRDTCPDIHKPSERLIAITPINKKKTIRSKSTDNAKNDRILQISSSTKKKNKLEVHSRIVKSCLNKSNCVVEPSGNANVQHSKSHTNYELMCVKCNSSIFDARHELCFLEFVSDMNACSKSKSVKKAKKKEEWKPTGKVFTKIGYHWRPTGRTFTLDGNACPLTRITATNKVPPREPILLEVVAQESVVTKVYTRRPKITKTNGSNSKPKIAKSVVQIVLWYLDSGCSKHMTGDRSQLTNFVHKFLGTVKFGNDQIAKIMGYDDYQIRNITISKVYYVEGLGHNLFSVGQLCDSDLEVAFRKHTCFVRNLEGVDLLSGSWETNLYTLSIGDMMASSPICLLSKASNTKS
ncbi:hypothetical protein Tco_0752290 [Tanacetum coccineum]|uniref:Retrovirus-related Pol polyprotein from transposon TNT 1-94-like beta-barrel domain-containing protein n=1 Tax=Tanacetum coccineum TaxID=301880 RepID=A0ABQ4Z6D8_9ASTR